MVGMAKIALSTTAATDAGIAASSTRTYLEISADVSGGVRWSFGAFYVEDDSQPLPASMSRIFEGLAAQSAFSFGPGDGFIRTSIL